MADSNSPTIYTAQILACVPSRAKSERMKATWRNLMKSISRAQWLCLALLLTCAPLLGAANLVHQFTFNDGTAMDSISKSTATLHGGATIAGGSLQLDGVDDYMELRGNPDTLQKKTLVAWVTLSNTNQSAGGVLTVENSDGDIFDSMAFGGLTPGQWMSGSEYSIRTSSEDNMGALDTAPNTEYQLAITYTKSVGGRVGIAIYRNGQSYASYAPLSALIEVFSNYTIVAGRQFNSGSETGSVLGNDTFLAASINELQIWDGILSPLEILNLTLTPVPEIASAAWMGAGLLAAGIGYRRRRSS